MQWHVYHMFMHCVHIVVSDQTERCMHNAIDVCDSQCQRMLASTVSVDCCSERSCRAAITRLLFACRLVWYFHALGYVTYKLHVVLGAIFITSLVCTVIESLPATLLDDNISVPLVAAGVSYALVAM